MADLKKIIKVTAAQYDVLASGGRVGDYVGLNDDYIYLIKDDTEYITSAGGSINGQLEITDLSHTPLTIEFNNNDYVIQIFAQDNEGNRAKWHIDVDDVNDGEEFSLSLPRASGSLATTTWVTDVFQHKDDDLTAIANLSGTTGLLRKTAANTWTLDTNNYATVSQIPTVNNATLTISQNSSSVGTFTANASSNVTVNITTPQVKRFI